MQMKQVMQCGVILLLTAGLNHVCQAQSKEETVQWIKLRLPYATAKRDDDTLAYHDVVVNGCSLIFTERMTGDNFDGLQKHGVVETVVTVPLGRLSVVDYVTGTDGGWDADSVELKAFDKIITAKWTTRKSRTGKPVETVTGSRSESEFDIVSSDADLAKRLAKALAHANELCGAKKEAF